MENPIDADPGFSGAVVRAPGVFVHVTPREDAPAAPVAGLSPSSSASEVLGSIVADVNALLDASRTAVNDFKHGNVFGVAKDASVLYGVLLRTEGDLKNAQADLLGLIHGTTLPQ